MRINVFLFFSTIDFTSKQDQKTSYTFFGGKFNCGIYNLYCLSSHPNVQIYNALVLYKWYETKVFGLQWQLFMCVGSLKVTNYEIQHVSVWREIRLHFFFPMELSKFLLGFKYDSLCIQRNILVKAIHTLFSYISCSIS